MKSQQIVVMLKAREFEALKSLLRNSTPPDVAEAMHGLDRPFKAVLFRLLGKDAAMAVFEYMNLADKEDLLEALTDEQTAALLNDMSPDDRTGLFEELPATLVKKYLQLLSPGQREVAHQLLGYREDSAGRLMTPDFVDLKGDQTIKAALQHIRRTAPNKETIYYCYVMSPTRHLIGFITLRELILADPDSKVKEIMHSDVIRVSTDSDQEDVARLLKDHDLIAVPVVDNENRLVGIITHDDIIDVIEEEDTEDIHRMGAITTGDRGHRYLDLTIAQSVKKRIGWLILLIALGSISSSILKTYSNQLQAAVVLAFFLPMLVDAGGNTGTQAATLIIRAITLGEVNKGFLLRVIRNELATGAVLGTILGLFGILRAYVLQKDLLLSVSVGLALTAVVMFSNLVGSLLPLLAEKLHLDPAAMAGPVVTTVVDVVGLILYFEIASRLLSL